MRTRTASALIAIPILSGLAAWTLMEPHLRTPAPAPSAIPEDTGKPESPSATRQEEPESKWQDRRMALT